MDLNCLIGQATKKDQITTHCHMTALPHRLLHTAGTHAVQYPLPGRLLDHSNLAPWIPSIGRRSGPSFSGHFQAFTHPKRVSSAGQAWVIIW